MPPVREIPKDYSSEAVERGAQNYWKENRIPEKASSRGERKYYFLDGPPYVTNPIHVGTAWNKILKDFYIRYLRMNGYRVRDQPGFDMHGLPIEVMVEKKIGIKSKKDIETLGIENFIKACRSFALENLGVATKQFRELGVWMGWDAPYRTLDNYYIESVWWTLRQLWDRGLLYQGYRVVPYCPRCGTALSDHEVAQGYEEAEDPSAYVRFPLRDRPGTSFLVWTTTPWTLPANVALAVHPDVRYALVEQDDERLILAEDLLGSALRGEYRVLETVYGRELVGLHYEPLYRFLPVEQDYAYVIPGEFVTTDEGTGVVHVAPAFGADDLAVGERHHLPVLQTVDLDGRFVAAVEPWAGMFVKDADPLIEEDLRRRGLLYYLGRHAHTYPFCWRCHFALLYYAKATWLVRTTAVRDRLVATNQRIGWYPDYIKDGRFGNWLENNIDWALGRERYWGTPLPVWQCDACARSACIGSVRELEERSGRDLSGLDLHRPFVDEVAFPCADCPGTMRRVPEVIDAWFDSGAMPHAQWHYPFENRERFAEQFPADFISEAVDQTRGWFYTLHAISNLLFGQESYRNCLVLGLVLDAEGRKMSKSLGNVISPWEVLDTYGADAMRWYLYTAAAPWADKRFSTELVGESFRKFLLTLWNTYAFFVTYANIDRYVPGERPVPPEERSLLDRWILSELSA
ncbi:MAG: isoleucine--tRNA ligase, partial [Anaerolineae bacterium]|nr:isoleucine--tRNA ligase [Anaerolineae bacterium]